MGMVEGCRGSRRRRFVGVILLVAAVVSVVPLLAACGSAASSKTILTVAGWGPGEQTFKKPWQAIKTAFEAKFPTIQLKLVGIPYESLQQQLTVQATGGAAPDVAQVDSAIDLPLAALGALAPLDDLMTAQAKADIPEGLLQASSYQGHLYAWPQSPAPYLLYANKDLRAKAGFTAAPKTWDELKTQATAIARLGKDAQGNRIWGFSPDTARWLVGTFDFLPAFYNFGGTEFDDKGKIQMDSAAGVAALSFYQGLVNDGVLGPPGSDVREMRTLFAKQQTGFYIDNPGGRGIIRDQSGMGTNFDSHYEAIAFPAQTQSGGFSIYYAHSFVVFKQSQHKKEAAQFLDFATRDPAITLEYFKATGLLSPFRSTQVNDAYKTDSLVSTVIDQAARVRRPFGARPDKAGELSDLFAVALQSVVVGKKDPAQALKSTNDTLKILLGQ